MTVGGKGATTSERTPPVTYQPSQDQLDAMTAEVMSRAARRAVTRNADRDAR